MLINRKNELLKKAIFILFFTAVAVFYLYLFIYLERKVLNISNIYHPDSKYYFETFKDNSYFSIYFSFFQNIKNFFLSYLSNQLYPSIINLIYEITNIVNQTENPRIFGFISIEFLRESFYRNVIKFNMLAYVLGNLLILFAYFKNFKKEAYNFKNLLLLTIILFLPYKTHLYSNILKDGIVLFLLIFFFTNKKIYSLIISVFIGLSIRWGFILYFLLFINKQIFSKKNLKIISAIIFILCIFIFFNFIYTDGNIIESLIKYVKERTNSTMGGRDYDMVPSYNHIPYGGLIRGIIWPILFLSGLFVLYTESYLFYVLAFEILLIQIFVYLFYKKFIFNLNLFVVIFIIGIYTSTFTSFFRYAYLAFYVSTLISFLSLKSPNLIKLK
tara:strand:- start:568 stop:1725 length:1158 start_codon:yes stop_codon:yes gene_type:complete